MAYNSDIENINDGEIVNADVANRPHDKLKENTDYLKDEVDDLNLGALTESQKNELTGGGTTALHDHGGVSTDELVKTNASDIGAASYLQDKVFTGTNDGVNVDITDAAGHTRVRMGLQANGHGNERHSTDFVEQGGNITDITTRNHNDLQNHDGGTAGQYYHLTSTQHNQLTSGGSTALHTHAAASNNGAILDYSESVYGTNEFPNELQIGFGDGLPASPGVTHSTATAAGAATTGLTGVILDINIEYRIIAGEATTPAVGNAHGQVDITVNNGGAPVVVAPLSRVFQDEGQHKGSLRRVYMFDSGQGFVAGNTLQADVTFFDPVENASTALYVRRISVEMRAYAP